MKDFDVVVIGSGAGGLTAAVALARAGRRVLVLEQHYLPGGWCHSFSLEGFQFSPGVHYIGELHEGGRMRAIYEGLGLGPDLTFLELNPDGFDHVRIGEERFDIPSGRSRLTDRLVDRFPREAAGIRRYLDIVAGLARELDGAMEVRGLGGLLGFPRRFPHLTRWGLSTLESLFDATVQDPLARAFLGIQAGDHGMPPSRAPAALHAAVVSHYFEGGYYPKGGARSLPLAFLRELRRNGGEIRVRSRVERILVEGRGKSRRVLGVRLADGTEVRAPVVVSNADPAITYDRLVGREHLSWRLRRKLAATRYSVSAVSLFLATDLDLEAAGLDSGNYWYSPTPDIGAAHSPDAQARLVERGEVPGLFLTATTLKDRGKRSDGLHTLEAFCLVPYEAFEGWERSEQGRRPEDYERLKRTLTRRMLETVDALVPGLSRHVVFSSLGTPLTNEHYVAATRGNLYGTEKSRRQVGPGAFPVRTEVPGLFHCGASTLGHGVAGATLSGLAAARSVLRCRSSELLDSRGRPLTVLPADPPERRAGRGEAGDGAGAEAARPDRRPSSELGTEDVRA